ncbi:RNA polymerase sigma factor [Streptomyces cucumeris]|uniref:RNA polymerase sigma factor n=1 Tax=Streptomyces cucumeris TaxID=2962890 RepID=UPI003D75A9D2
MNDSHEEGSPSVRVPLSLPLEFERHYICNQEAYHQYALAHLKTPQAAEEAVHRAFLETLRLWDRIEGKNHQQQTWAIVRRVVISQALMGAQARLINSDNRVHQALAKLPPKQFDAIVLRYWMKKDTKDIAWYMGIVPSTVDHHCRKGRERLIQALSRHVQKKTEKPNRKNRNKRRGS